MAHPSTKHLGDAISTLDPEMAGSPVLAELNDRQLLARFVHCQDESAFETLVRRHGKLVRGTCQRVLHDPADIDDAFQATFLVLARKAGSLRWQKSVAGWLYAVAYRISMKARVGRARRQRHEQEAGRMGRPPQEQGGWRELQQALDEELQGLPEKYRVPLLLCCLEGLARDEVAQRLGCSLGAVKGRLERGRELLRLRLTRRGLLPSSVLLSALLTQDSAASVPPAVVSSTVRTGLSWALGQGSASTISPSVLTLAKGVMQTMFLTKMKVLGALTVVLAMLGLGLGLASRYAHADKEGEKKVRAEGDRKEGDRKEGDRRKGDRREGDRDRKREPEREGRREGRREGDREGRREGRRDGDREGRGRMALCVVPLSGAPDAETMSALTKLFGTKLRITSDMELKILVLQGRESLVDAAVQALSGSIDRKAGLRERRDEGDERERGPAIEVVRLYKKDASIVTKLIKKYVTAKDLLIVERPKSKALIIEGDRGAVAQAVSLARQIDGQQLHPSVRRLLFPRGEERERD